VASLVVESDLSDYDLNNDFVEFPRRVLGQNNTKNEEKEKEKKQQQTVYKLPNVLSGGLYLKKMRKGSKIIQGLALKEVTSGPRFAIINAVGGINSGLLLFLVIILIIL
jgi:hypothetical protein